MEFIFTFKNTRGAIAGERALMDGGLAVKVMALPDSLGAGCGLCLRVREEDLNAAARLLAEADAEPEGVFKKILDESGRCAYEPVAP